MFFSVAVAACVGPVPQAGLGATQVIDIDNPVSRQLNWFAYLNGEDIRASCGPGSSDRLRLVLNARYTEHVRTFEVHRRSGAAELEVRALTGLVLGSDIPLSSLEDILRGRPRSVRLGGAGEDALWRALEADGALAPITRALWLDSNTIHWVMSGCRNGQVVFHAWQAPRHDLAALTFPAVLRTYDPNEIPWPRLDGPPPVPQGAQEQSTRPGYSLEAHPDGLRY